MPKRIANKAEIKAKTRAINTCVSVTMIQFLFVILCKYGVSINIISNNDLGLKTGVVFLRS